MDRNMWLVLFFTLTFTFGYFAGSARVAGEYIDNYEALSADLDKLRENKCNNTGERNGEESI